jgi:hemoglobin
MRVVTKTIYEAAGGMPAFRRLANANHERCLAEPELNHAFSHPGHPDHVERLASYWAEVFGGPTTYSDTCGGQTHMLWMHSGSGAPEDWGDRFLACFVAALDDANLPEDPELRAALRSYMEWASRDVIGHAPQDSVVPPGLALPRWSWDGLQPGAT